MFNEKQKQKQLSSPKSLAFIFVFHLCLFSRNWQLATVFKSFPRPIRLCELRLFAVKQSSVFCLYSLFLAFWIASLRSQ